MSIFAMKRRLLAAILLVACALSLAAQDERAETSSKRTFEIQSEQEAQSHHLEADWKSQIKAE